MNRLSADYFEKIYERDPDPWGFESRWYEARKYALTLAALPRRWYDRAFEPGCANGVLTELLADRCRQLIAADVVPSVVERAASRLAHRAHVTVASYAIPDAWPEGSFDLIVLSEVAYYMTPAGFDVLLGRLDASLAAAGHLVAVHWTGETDYPLRGADVHERLDRHQGWARLVTCSDPQFLLSVYEKKSP